MSQNTLPVSTLADINNMDLEVLYLNHHYPNNSGARKHWIGRTDDSISQIFNQGYAKVFYADIWENTALPQYNEDKAPIVIPIDRIVNVINKLQ